MPTEIECRRTICQPNEKGGHPFFGIIRRETHGRTVRSSRMKGYRGGISCESASGEKRQLGISGCALGTVKGQKK